MGQSMGLTALGYQQWVGQVKPRCARAGVCVTVDRLRHRQLCRDDGERVGDSHLPRCIVLFTLARAIIDRFGAFRLDVRSFTWFESQGRFPTNLL